MTETEEYEDCALAVSTFSQEEGWEALRFLASVAGYTLDQCLSTMQKSINVVRKAAGEHPDSDRLEAQIKLPSFRRYVMGKLGMM